MGWCWSQSPALPYLLCSWSRMLSQRLTPNQGQRFCLTWHRHSRRALRWFITKTCLHSFPRKDDQRLSNYRFALHLKDPQARSSCSTWSRRSWPYTRVDLRVEKRGCHQRAASSLLLGQGTQLILAICHLSPYHQQRRGLVNSRK